MTEFIPSSDGVGVEHTTPKEVSPKGEFSFDDLVFMEKRGMGLRHISARTVADDNLRNGFNGDALALYAVGGLISDDMIETSSDEAKKIFEIHKKFKVTPKLELLKDMLGESEKNKIVNLVHSSIVTFIQQSFNYDDFGLERGRTTVGEFFEILRDKSTFLVVVNRNNSTSRDQSEFWGLGKTGKQPGKPDDIKGVVYGSDVAEDLKDLPRSEVVTEEFIDRNVAEGYYRLIVGKVSEARNSELNK